MARVTEMDRSEIIFRMEVSLESEHSKTDDVELGCHRDDGIVKYVRWEPNTFQNFVLPQSRKAQVI